MSFDQLSSRMGDILVFAKAKAKAKAKASLVGVEVICIV